MTMEARQVFPPRSKTAPNSPKGEVSQTQGNQIRHPASTRNAREVFNRLANPEGWTGTHKHIAMKLPVSKARVREKKMRAEKKRHSVIGPTRHAGKRRFEKYDRRT